MSDNELLAIVAAIIWTQTEWSQDSVYGREQRRRVAIEEAQKLISECQAGLPEDIIRGPSGKKVVKSGVIEGAKSK